MWARPRRTLDLDPLREYLRVRRHTCGRASEVWEMEWSEIVGMHSKYSAPPGQREVPPCYCMLPGLNPFRTERPPPPLQMFVLSVAGSRAGASHPRDWVAKGEAAGPVIMVAGRCSVAAVAGGLMGGFGCRLGRACWQRQRRKATSQGTAELESPRRAGGFLLLLCARASFRSPPLPPCRFPVALSPTVGATRALLHVFSTLLRMHLLARADLLCQPALRWSTFLPLSLSHTHRSVPLSPSPPFLTHPLLRRAGAAKRA